MALYFARDGFFCEDTFLFILKDMDGGHTRGSRFSFGSVGCKCEKTRRCFLFSCPCQKCVCWGLMGDTDHTITTMPKSFCGHLTSPFMPADLQPEFSPGPNGATVCPAVPFSWTDRRLVCRRPTVRPPYVSQVAIGPEATFPSRPSTECYARP